MTNKTKLFVCIDRIIIDENYKDDDELSLWISMHEDREDAERYANENDAVVCEKTLYHVDRCPEVQSEPTPEENPLATRFGGRDNEWNKYLKLRKGDKVRFKNSTLEYKGHEDDVFTMTSDGCFSMGGTLCGMFDKLSGAYGMYVFDVVEE